MGSSLSRSSLEGVQGDRYHPKGSHPMETVDKICRDAAMPRWYVRARVRRFCVR